MKRFRMPLVILGVVGALVVAAIVFVVIKAGRGAVYQIPVAIDNIPPGTELSPGLFRIDEMRGLDPTTRQALVEAHEFGRVVGHPTLEMIHAGGPLLWAQVDPERQPRLTLTLSDPAHLVYPLPVAGAQVGNFIVAGDVVDVIFTLGRVSAQELVHVETLEGPVAGMEGPVVAPTPAGPRPGDEVETVLRLPVAKVVLGDVRVLRVEREQVRATSASVGMGTGAEQAQPQVVEGPIIRLYLELTREQAEILSFALHNGMLNLPARAEPAGGQSEGFTWDDFERLFFEGRPDAELRGERR